MIDQIVIIIALFLIYYHISGLATTNILRLTTGNTLSVLVSKCCCNSCGAAIPPLLQLPIISYIICRGQCKICGAKIPLFPLFLELSVFAGMCLLSALLRFTYLGITVSFLFYELVRGGVVVWKGKRSVSFSKQYCIAVLSMIPFYLLSLFVALLYRIV